MTMRLAGAGLLGLTVALLDMHEHTWAAAITLVLGVRLLIEGSQPAWPRPTREQVLAALDDWGSLVQVAQRLGTKQYGRVASVMHSLHADGLTEDRWEADDGKYPRRRQYRRLRRAEPTRPTRPSPTVRGL